ncbi:hypothetical protein DFH09DRAFT_1138230 [Mycena vulgaris]|nr:hypothetical protein DFH09DRAFT_1138230 [Mycena vulgaris]
MATRQTTPGANPVVLAPTNSLKRALSEDADSDAPDSKKIKLKSENTPQSKDKRKRKKKKKKKTPIVVPLELPNATPASSHVLLLSPTLTPSRSSMNTAKGKRKATSAPPAPPLPAEVEVESVGEDAEEPTESPQIPDPAESSSATIARLTQELSSQSVLLKRHETTLAQFNQSLTCQVCLDLLHKPFALAPCGHIACYNCLVAWFTSEPDEPHFVAGPRKKTCPHCRATVKERPVEVWSIKDMVAALLRSGLLSAPSAAPPPLPELPGTPQTADTPHDPWHNIFRYPHQHPRFHPLPPNANGEPPSVEDMGMLDMEDGGVYRCLDCMHEIWDGVCTSCHRVYPGHRSRYDDDDMDGGMFDDDSDEEGGPVYWPMPLGYGGMMPLPLPLPFDGGWWNGEDSGDESGGLHFDDDLDDDDDDDDGFIDDGDEDEGVPRIIEINDSDSEHGSSPPRRRVAPTSRGRRAPRITLLSSDDEEEDDVVDRPSRRRRASRAASEVIVVSEDDDTDTPRTIHARTARHARDEDDGDEASTTASSRDPDSDQEPGLRGAELMDLLGQFEDPEQGRTDSEVEENEGW